jgi:pilus assembly protein CpaF
MAELDLPYLAVAEQVASALDLVVHQARLADGRRRVVEVAAVTRADEGPRLETLVRWRARDRWGERVEGDFEELPGAAAWLEAAARDARLAEVG